LEGNSLKNYDKNSSLIEIIKELLFDLNVLSFIQLTEKQVPIERQKESLRIT
jgi:hypothetical protein